MNLDDTICYCFHISKRKILNFIRVRKPRRASQISDCGGAGTGCGWCVSYLKRYFAESQGESRNDAELTSADDYARHRAAYIKAGHGKPAAGAIPLPQDPESHDPERRDPGPRDPGPRDPGPTDDQRP